MTTLTLGGVVLNPSMVIEDRYRSSGVAQSVRRTVGGALKVFVSSLQKGAEITLRGTEDAGWIDKATSDLLLEMAEQPGGIYQLSVAGVVYTVVFRHQDAPAYQATPLIPRTGQQDSDKFICTIKLLTI